MVSGNKGGVGKSLFCKALASAFEMRGEQFAVLDGDGRTGDVYSAFRRKCPARQGDFRQLRPESHNCNLDLLYEHQLVQLLDGSPHLICNTPDGADTILMKWFDVTLRHTESNNINFRFVYLMSDRPDGLDLLPQLAERFQFLYPVRNLYFGKPVHFEVFNKQYLDGFKVVLDLPRLRAEDLRMMFDRKTYPAEALRLDGRTAKALPTLNRARLYAWQAGVNEMVLDMLENTQMPNLEFDKW